MTIPSVAFFVFLATCVAAYHLVPRGIARQLVLLAANVVFVASYLPGDVSPLPLAGFLVFGYATLAVVRSGISRPAFAGLIVLTVAAFVWLKRYTFLPQASFLPFAYMTLGLSYIFFRVLHLLVDARDETLPPVSPVQFLNYTINFTTFVSGPIQRYQDFRAIEAPPPRGAFPTLLGRSLERLALGCFKFAIVSPLLLAEVTRALHALTIDQTIPSKLLDGMSVVLVYPVYLYFNFSGYIDIAIGAALLFGLKLPENFNRPFSSESFIGFWSRWHITLSDWLKTYVYSPLLVTLMRRFPAPALEPYLGVLAFFVTFFLIGVWHGQTSEFMVFGLLQGLGVGANKTFQILMTNRLGRRSYRALCAEPLYRAAARGLTFCWFAFTLSWFWASWAQIGDLYGALGPVLTPAMWLVALACATLALAAGEGLRTLVLSVRRGDAPVVASRYARTVWSTALAVVTVSLVLLLDAPAPDIVYKAF